METNVIEQYWKDFLNETGRDPNTKYLEYFHFDLTEKNANELLALVLDGKKQATASSVLRYEVTKEPMPKVGDLSIITDWDGNPRCVIETIATTIIPFKDIDYDTCKREGEDDNLESWQIGHTKFYTEDGKQCGYEFTWDMPVLFEDFRVVYRGNQ